MSRPAATDLLAFVDQGAAAGTRATGRNSLIQIVWIYDHGVDLEGLETFRRALARGLLGRRVAASPLPFGRDRWVASSAAPQIAVVAQPRPREEIDTWVDQRAAVPIDPWSGPGWHLGVLPLTDGGSAVTLVVSHVLADGVGAATAAAEAALGTARELPYPREAAPVWRSAPRDAALTARQLPAAVRAVAAASKLAKGRLAPSVAAAPPHPVGPDRWTVAHLDRTALAARAAALGGTETTLLFGVTGAIADALGWVQPADGAAVLGLSVNRRTDGDLRGNAIVDAEITVDPGAGPEGIAALRGSVKQTLAGLGDEGRYDVFGPLITLLPRRTLAALIDAPPDPARPVTTCAGVGALPAPVRAPDGTPADRAWFRLAWSNLPGRETGPRPPYLYVGWTGTDDETSLFAATNLAAAEDLSAVVDGAVAELVHRSPV
ncbi:Diacylglycerol O-acyltransferase OS=Tsukamurella paurometabola (strain ATCC 8368 / DSM / CCUG 35730 / CIP 100753 / JCM 10117 / KCTC 9821 / NBRC 16120 /NCIMB 702349 / NCTC 13040) OX=521096 GN=Tpau_1035 PE=4 SV=1 [Tsukamurella paurometabola]|uniref:Diacylglycerol O-acyltransferase n=1 Tax=Tsukamurella paurometabola (strain ATCC 8368 / DSM 20162 / CCUG 35730 / CIP 100753 / JCM 10117 / KCTC 9821 / NBRC 16120 / NCIMB 702349 / NCTC 13040) TaxID=521096 RepID=D5UV78_TSUPD|nr:hypothetical protein [Tsukamurella paurometabola]ADG77668.1 protein of unknown function UPF0089 [Tsukamurella paurometabola DSM 20162]SUP28214.1 Uncharacterised protein [Tsukamurella paurometabola]